MKTGKVVGFGGVFFRCKDKEGLINWYKTHLGFDIADWGAIFPLKQVLDQAPAAYNVWSPFPADTDYFKPSNSSFMFNFIVDDLDALLQNLTASGIDWHGEPEESEFGKFAWVIDPEGNKVELWEPAK
ncbi:MAG: VOC family protein [Bacteroidetes bacterium]|nr:VOC family protein [Bacteroidota bacterium]